MTKHFCLLAGIMGLTGCARAPSVNILGAYFPAWMLCIITGIVLTFVLRGALITLKLDDVIGPRGLVYPAMVIALTLGTWLLFFKN